MSVQQWMLLIVPNAAMAGMLVYVCVGLWLNDRDRKTAEQRHFEQHRRML